MKALSMVGRAMRFIFSKEELPEDHPGPFRKPDDGQGLLSWLLKPEMLEKDPMPASLPRQSFLSWLFSKEQLPQDPAEAKRKGGFFRELFGPDPLPWGNGTTQGTD